MFASFVQGPLVRVIPVGLVLVALQRTIFVDIQIAGVIVPIVMALAAAAGVAGGSERGAVVGFTLGLMYDLAEGTPLGSTATAMTVAGAFAGLLALIAADPHWWLEAMFSGLGAAVGVAMIPVVRSFIGEPQAFESQFGVVIVVAAATAALLSPLLVRLARWCLRVRRAE